MIEDKDALRVFDSLVKIDVGDGSRVLFWRDRWIHGFAVVDIAPLIYGMVDTRTINRRTVGQAMVDNRWCFDVTGDLSFTTHMQLMHLGMVVNSVQRDLSSPDRFSWPADPSGVYTAKSTYRWLCDGT